MIGVQLILIVLSILLVGILAFPLISRTDSAYLFLNTYKNSSIKGNPWNFAVKKLTPRLNVIGLGTLDRLLRLSGNTTGRSAAEWLLIYLAVLIPGMFMAATLPNARTAAVILVLLIPYSSINRLRTKAQRRKLEAEEAARFMKRQIAVILRQKVPVIEALQMISDDMPGDFGEAFRRHLDEVSDGKSLRVAMREFREEFEAVALETFCLAVELADAKSPEILADQLYRQVLDENNRMEEFIEQKKESTNNRMILVVAVSFVWTLAVIGFFAYYGFTDTYRDGGFLFF